MRKGILFLISIVASITLGFAQDSLAVQKYDFEQGDTMVNLNRINGGVLKYQVSDKANDVLLKNGLQIKEPAVIIVENPALLSDEFSIEIKCYTSEEEWFINDIYYKKGKLLNVKSDKIEMATTWRKEGKIYVVLATVCIVFLGLFLYVFWLDRKISNHCNCSGI